MNQKISRRRLLGGAAAVAGATLLGRGTSFAQEDQLKHPNIPGPSGQTTNPPSGQPINTRTQPAWMRPPHPVPGEPGKQYKPVVVPNGSTLPWKVVDGVKVMHLTAEEVEHEFVPGSADNQPLRALCWGYNGQVHGPTIECVEGDRLRIYVTNNLPAATTIHWHAMIIPSGMDGVGGLSQKAIQPGETYKYEFTVWQHGTFMYHSHHDEMTQIGLGMTGMIVVHPREPEPERPDRDFVILLHEWRIDVGTRRPNPNEMTDFNILTMNARAFPGTAPLVAKLGDKVRIRLGNLSPMEHHPIHIHGHAFTIVETDGGPIPQSAQRPEATVLVPVGSTRTIEFVANNPGDWPFHCHMTHHVMNQMGHQFPNMIGVNPGDVNERANKILSGFMTMGEAGMADMGTMGMKVPKNSVPMIGLQTPKDYITMGGMYTNLKVRENLEAYDKDPGWYQDPPGTLATLASNDEMNRDLGFVPTPQKKNKPMDNMNMDQMKMQHPMHQHKHGA
jgi:FtsP/CotA-like multicopper oxidase with cupredoxin domain